MVMASAEQLADPLSDVGVVPLGHQQADSFPRHLMSEQANGQLVVGEVPVRFRGAHGSVMRRLR